MTNEITNGITRQEYRNNANKEGIVKKFIHNVKKNVCWTPAIFGIPVLILLAAYYNAKVFNGQGELGLAALINFMLYWFSILFIHYGTNNEEALKKHYESFGKWINLFEQLINVLEKLNGIFQSKDKQ